jgi:hypothetical protein
MADILTLITKTSTPHTYVLDESPTTGRAFYNVALVRLIPYRRSGIPSLTFVRFLGGKSGASAPPCLFDGTSTTLWDGASVSLIMGLYSATVPVFVGDVVGHSDRYVPRIGWVREYECAGLAKRADYIAVTDPNTNTDLSIWNSSIDDPSAIVAREGQSVGTIVTNILTMQLNARALNAAGIGGYTVTGSIPNETYALNTPTTTDLASLTFIPQARVTIGGERILQALEGFVQQFHPNHCLHVEPGGNIRFLDQSSSTVFPSTTLTLGSDPRLDMPEIHCDYSECYGRVEVRGETLVKAIEVSTAGTTPGLVEAFAWDSLSSSAAKSAYQASDWQNPLILNSANTPKYGDSGTVSGVTTTTVNYHSSNASLTWPNHYWENSGSNAFGWIVLRDATIVNGLNEYFSAKITGCPALTAGGTITLQLDRALPVTTYTTAQIYGLAAGPTVVYTRYQVVNTALRGAMVNFFPYPVPYVFANGTGAVMTNAPMGAVILTQTTSLGPQTYSVTLPITTDPTSGYIYFPKPTALVFGGGTVTPPTEVRALLAIADPAGLQAWAPSSSTYAGTGNSLLGLTRTKVITVHDWKDASGQVPMNTFAAEWLKSAQDVVFEGTVPYLGLLPAMLDFGHAIALAASGYTTGLETTPLPVIEAVLDFHEDERGATIYTMALNCSNRRQRYSADVFTRPPIRPELAQIGFEGLTTEDFTKSFEQYNKYGISFTGPGVAETITGAAEGFQAGAGAAGGGESFIWGPGAISERGPDWVGKGESASWGPDKWSRSGGVSGSFKPDPAGFSRRGATSGDWGIQGESPPPGYSSDPEQYRDPASGDD